MNQKLRYALLIAMTVVAACGGGSKQAAGTGGAGDALATLQVISTQVAVKSAADFTPANSGQNLTTGNQVRTDPQGFAEVTFFEGSWMRVEAGATLTINDLVDAENGQAVSTGIDTGRSWQRVEQLTESGDTFEVSTPVATAAVRGTAFAIDCTTADRCTFSVVEGVVELRLPDGTTITLGAFQQLTLTRNQPPGTPTDVDPLTLSQNPWIAKNLPLDVAKRSQSNSGQSSGTAQRAPLTVDPCTTLTDAQVIAYADSIGGEYKAQPPLERFSVPAYTLNQSGGSQRPIDSNFERYCTWQFDLRTDGGTYNDSTVQVHVRRLTAEELARTGSACTFSTTRSRTIPGIGDRAEAVSANAAVLKGDACTSVSYGGAIGSEVPANQDAIVDDTLRALVAAVGSG